MTWELAVTLISVVGTVCAVVFAFIGNHKGAKKESESDGYEHGSMMSEIGYIKANTDEIKIEQKEQRKFNTDFAVRLTAVEESTKSAHKRIDNIINKEK